MSLERFVLTVFAIIAFALVWNGVVHGLVLRDAETALVGLARPATYRSLPLALLLTTGIAVLFVFLPLLISLSFRERDGVREIIIRNGTESTRPGPQ